MMGRWHGFQDVSEESCEKFNARLPALQNVKGKYFASSFGSFRIKRIKLIPILSVWKCHKFNKVNMFFLYL